MRSKISTGMLYALLFCAPGLFAQKEKGKEVTAQPSSDSVKKTPPKASITEKVKSSRKIEGLLTLYQDTSTGSVQIYVRKDQLGKQFIYQSFSLGGPNILGLNRNMIRTTWVFEIRKAYDKLEFSQVNTSFWYDPSNAVSRAANVDLPEAVFYSDKTVAEDEKGYLIAGDALFLSEKLDQVKPTPVPGIPPTAVFNLGSLNTSKSKYGGIRSYPNNTDVIVDLAYENPVPLNPGGKDITDPRYNRIKMQHSFLEVPKNDFVARRDDPRIGYFSEEVDNLTTTEVPNYRDIIHRWNLKKKDPGAALSEPVEPIVWWVENTTPVEYRETILEAGLKWNEAFEKAGFKNAIVMKIMPDTASWDPADIRYNTIRWVASPKQTYGAIGPSFVNPLTGEILGADITVEWLSGSGAPIYEDLFGVAGAGSYGIPSATTVPPAASGVLKNSRGQYADCNLSSELALQYAAGMTALETENAPPARILEIHKQFLYYLVLHEMGHCLGLNHNMKASGMLSPAELNDTSITHKRGLIGSVMDYPAVSVPADRSKQGDFFTTKPGPYDLWAIEYGYTECNPSDEAAVLSKIASRSGEHELAFGNDADDMRTAGGGGIDPRVMIGDLSSDAVAYGEDRFKLLNNTISRLKGRYNKPDRSYADLNFHYLVLVKLRIAMAAAVSRYIGGIYEDRSFTGQGSANKPFTPVPVDYQKKAMQVLSKYVFAPNAFDADKDLFPYLQNQRRGFEFFGITEDPKPQNAVLTLQMSVLAQVLSSNALQRVNSTSLYGNTYSVADVMNDLTKAIFEADRAGKVNLYRQDIQTEYVKMLITISTSGSGTYDDPSRAAALGTIKKIKSLLATTVSPDEQTRAHRANLNFLIDKALAIK